MHSASKIYCSNNFPAYSWVLAKRLLSGWLVGKSCQSHVSLSVRAIAAEGRQARVCVPCVSMAGQERHDSAECIIQRRFAIHVDNVPSCKLGPARMRPRVTKFTLLTVNILASNGADSEYVG